MKNAEETIEEEQIDQEDNKQEDSQEKRDFKSYWNEIIRALILTK